MTCISSGFYFTWRYPYLPEASSAMVSTIGCDSVSSGSLSSSISDPSLPGLFGDVIVTLMQFDLESLLFSPPGPSSVMLPELSVPGWVACS